jgi:hypothetical protein
MLSNEVFALACRAWYEEQGLIVDARNGEFAHCPLPERYGDTGYYLLHEHHQHQGLLQSRDIGECCFFVGHTKQWLKDCGYWPDNYFELWDIYEEYCQIRNKDLHSERTPDGKSAHAVKMGKKGGKESAKKLHSEKNEEGKSIQGVKNGQRMNRSLHYRRDENGKSLHALKHNEVLHEVKEESGKSAHAVRMGKKAHEEKDDKGRSVTAMKTCSQVWESTVDGYRSNPGSVASHNKRNGWDPKARVRIA